MSTVEDFENAPLGATATHNVTGSRAMKINNDEWCWIVKNGFYKGNEGMGDYTLDQPAPTTAREALDLAWELAHPVKEGQVIPVGAWLVDRRYNKITVDKNTSFNITMGGWGEENIRTLEPLPDPEPDWLDAPAVLARPDGWSLDEREVFIQSVTHPDRWANIDSTFHWSDLRDVTPLYTKGQDA